MYKGPTRFSATPYFSPDDPADDSVITADYEIVNERDITPPASRLGGAFRAVKSGFTKKAAGLAGGVSNTWSRMDAHLENIQADDRARAEAKQAAKPSQPSLFDKIAKSVTTLAAAGHRLVNAKREEMVEIELIDTATLAPAPDIETYAYQEYDRGLQPRREVKPVEPKRSLFQKLAGRAKDTLTSLLPTPKENAPVAVNDNPPTPSLLQRAARTGVSLAAQGAAHIAQTPKNLINGVIAAGRSLADPETRVQTGVELAANALLINGAKAAAATIAATAAAPLAISMAGLAATTGLVGGLLETRRQYNAAKNHFIDTTDNSESFQSRRRYLWNNKKQFGLNVLKHAATGLVGSAAGAAIGGLVHHFNTPAAGIPQVDHVRVPVPPPTAALEAPVKIVPPVTVAPSALDQAIDIVRSKSGLSEHTFNLAHHGDSVSIEKIAHVIDTDHDIGDDHLVAPLHELAAANRVAVPVQFKKCPLK